MAAHGGGQVDAVQRASANASPFQSHVPLTTAIARGPASLPIAPQLGTNRSGPEIPFRPGAPSLRGGPVSVRFWPPALMLGHAARNVAGLGGRGRPSEASPPVPFIGSSKPAISRAVFGSFSAGRRLSYAVAAPVPSLSPISPLAAGRATPSTSPTGLARPVATPRLVLPAKPRPVPAEHAFPFGHGHFRPKPLSSVAVHLPAPAYPLSTQRRPLRISAGRCSPRLCASSERWQTFFWTTRPLALHLPGPPPPALCSPGPRPPAPRPPAPHTPAPHSAGTAAARTPLVRNPPARSALAQTPRLGPAGTARPPLPTRTLAPIQPGIPRAQAITAPRGLTPAWATLGKFLVQ